MMATRLKPVEDGNEVPMDTSEFFIVTAHEDCPLCQQAVERALPIAESIGRCTATVAVEHVAIVEKRRFAA